MASKDLVNDDLWQAIQPLLPPELARHHGGPPRVAHRAALGGVLFILRTGLRWRDLPRELGCGSGVTCWRRLRQWQDLGIWAAVHQVVLNWLGDLDAIEWSRASIDSVSVRANAAASTLARTPPIAASGAASINSWWIGRVCHWRCSSRPRMCTTRSC